MPGKPGRTARGEGEARAPALREEDRAATGEDERSGTSSAHLPPKWFDSLGLVRLST